MHRYKVFDIGPDSPYLEGRRPGKSYRSDHLIGPRFLVDQRDMATSDEETPLADRVYPAEKCRKRGRQAEASDQMLLE
jgi:hypothetical protein